MKKFSINCDFGGQRAPFDFYVGMPKEGNHPIQNQANWLSTNRGGNVPGEIMESFSKILKLSQENGVDFEELCVYAFKEAYRLKEVEGPAKPAPAPVQEQQKEIPAGRAIGGASAPAQPAQPARQPQQAAPAAAKKAEPTFEKPALAKPAPPLPPAAAATTAQPVKKEIVEEEFILEEEFDEPKIVAQPKTAVLPPAAQSVKATPMPQNPVSIPQDKKPKNDEEDEAVILDW